MRTVLKNIIIIFVILISPFKTFGEVRRGDTVALSLDTLDIICRGSYNFDTLYKYANFQLKKAQVLKNREFNAYALFHLSRYFYDKSRYNKSIGLCYQALGFCDYENSTEFVGHCYMMLSRNYYSLGDFLNAESFCRKALEIYDYISSPYGIAQCNLMFGLYCLKYQLFELGRQYVSSSFQISYGKYPEGEIVSLRSYGYCDYARYCRKSENIGQLLSAISWYNLAMKYLAKYPDIHPVNYAVLMQQTSLAYSRLAIDSKKMAMKKMYADSSRKYYELCTTVTEKLNSSENDFYAESAEINCLIAEGNLTEAEKKINKISLFVNSDPEHFSRFGENFCNIVLLFSHCKKDYKSMLYYMEKLNNYKYRHYGFDLGTKITRTKSKENYDRIICEIEADKKIRDSQFEEKISKGENLQRYLLTIVILIVVIAVLFLLLRFWENTVNKRLKIQSDDIKQQTLKLNLQNSEFYELQRKFNTEKEELLRHKKKFIKANMVLHNSLLRAWDFQSALIPSKEKMQQYFGDCLIFFKPCHIVSGDFFWAVETEEVKILVTADCTGHGVPGAFMSMLGISSLNDIALKRDLNSKTDFASGILEDMRQKIITSLHQSYTPDGEIYETIDMSVCILERKEMFLQYAGANRPLWIFSLEGEKCFEPDEITVGIDLMPGVNNFTNHRIEIFPGDVVYTFSDGITDQFGGRNGKMKFGSKRLKELLSGIYSENFDTQYLKIADSICEWTTIKSSGDDEMEFYCAQLDDQLLLGIRIEG